MRTLELEEIKEIAYHLDELIGNNFYDVMYNVILEREGDEEVEVSDEDILAIKEQLKRIL
jgi:hypothetical protein